MNLKMILQRKFGWDLNEILTHKKTQGLSSLSRQACNFHAIS